MSNLTYKQTTYLQPEVEIIEVENEASVMTGSDTLPDINGGGDIFPSSSSAGTQQQASSMQEVEDMLNDFLTF